MQKILELLGAAIFTAFLIVITLGVVDLLVRTSPLLLIAIVVLGVIRPKIPFF